VRTGQHVNGRVEVLSGLRPGQRVVTEGIIKVTDGMEVRLQGQGPPAGQQARRGP
jgi:membrane fusion protein (multidrug efflux system)